MEEEPKHNCYHDLEYHFKKLEATGELFRKWLDEKSKMKNKELVIRARKDANEKMEAIKAVAASQGVSPIELIRHTLRLDKDDD